jgi:signal transduction histidine kinase/ActR/RegA family two-component response regulator
VRGRNRQYQAREQITLIQDAQARYRDLQLQLRIAVDASQLGTFHCEMPLGKIIWNTRCKEHFWLPPDAEVDFDLFYSILHPDDRERTRAAVDACVYHAKPYDIEYRTVSPKGDIRWVRATGRTFFDDQGQPLRFDGTTQDITERRRAAEEREQLLQSEQAARAELERAGRMKDEFLATLSHELRTPLNAILGWSQLLRQDHDPATVEEGLEVIERNARVQVQLIEDLLDMSRIISGKVRLNVQPTDPNAFIRAAIETVRPSARARGIQLESLFDPRVGLIAGDANRMQQVVWNLLSNAIKFTPSGGKVSVALRRRESNIEIAVSDTGQGIPADFLPHVFERFRQADSSSTRPHGGLGLGLAIVKQIMELHGGTITAASEGAGRGSVFTATLPVLAMDRDASNDDSKKPAAAFGKPAFKEKVLDGMTVLVVDDEMDARGLTQRVLEECGAHVVTAASAVDAIDKLSAIKPDVLVSDIGMPEVDGYELLRRVRALGGSHGGDVPAIALTAFARSEDRARALLAGYRVHVSKPVHPHELVATVASVAGRGGNAGDCK